MNKKNNNKLITASNLVNINSSIIHEAMMSIEQINSSLLTSFDLQDNVFVVINEMTKQREKAILDMQRIATTPLVLPCLFDLFNEINKIQEENYRLLNSQIAEMSLHSINVIKQDFLSTEIAINALLDLPIQDKVKEFKINYSVHDETKNKLKKVNESYVYMYEGVIEAVNSDNPDKARQVFVSLRELLIGLLNDLSPTNKVLNWINNLDEVPKEFLLENGNPSRKAQIIYFYREDQDGFLCKSALSKNDFIESRINQTNSLHEKLLKLTDKQLCRIANAMRFIVDDLLVDYEE